jgi:hypothetical protein
MTVTISDIIHVLRLFKSQRSGDWTLSPSAGGTYQYGPNNLIGVENPQQALYILVKEELCSWARYCMSLYTLHTICWMYSYRLQIKWDIKEKNWCCCWCPETATSSVCVTQLTGFHLKPETAPSSVCVTQLTGFHLKLETEFSSWNFVFGIKNRMMDNVRNCDSDAENDLPELKMNR